VLTLQVYCLVTNKLTQLQYDADVSSFVLEKDMPRTHVLDVSFLLNITVLRGLENVLSGKNFSIFEKKSQLYSLKLGGVQAHITAPLKHCQHPRVNIPTLYKFTVCFRNTNYGMCAKY
jgi:hypothetical protein